MVGTPKTHQGRTITFPRFLSDDLAAYMGTLDGELLFPDERGGFCAIRTGDAARSIVQPGALASRRHGCVCMT